jgi:hypothetical protein
MPQRGCLCPFLDVECAAQPTIDGAILSAIATEVRPAGAGFFSGMARDPETAQNLVHDTIAGS